MDTDDLSLYLAALDRDACYRVDAVYKEGRFETTERVFFRGENGSELGPFVRKRISCDSGLGGAYETVFSAQRRGVRLAHLPYLLECFRQDGDIVVVMEHVEGVTLGACVGRLDGSDARLGLVRRVFPDLCDAVSELHERLDPPVIHRDLKPSNVMVSAGGITLIDLGIARVFKEGGEQDTVHFGTRAYAPPEQFGFGQTGVTSDVYALGMLLFFCLSGREAGAGDREGGFACPGVPAGLAAVIRRATELDPAARYGSVRELRDDLVRALAPAVPFGGGAEKDPVARVPPDTFSYDAAPGRVGSLLARVPPALGAAWDLLVLAAAVILVAACVTSFLDPTPQNARWPVWYLALSYLGFMVPLVLIGCYLVLDRRPLRRAFPRLSRLTVRRETTVGLLAMLAILVAWVLATAVVQL